MKLNREIAIAKAMLERANEANDTLAMMRLLGLITILNNEYIAYLEKQVAKQVFIERRKVDRVA